MTAMPPPPPPDVGSVTLNDEARRLLDEARQRRKRINRAVSVATFNAWSAAALALLSAPFVFLDPLTAVAVLVLGAVAVVEFRGRAMVRRLDERGLLMLAANQAGLGLAVIAYACYQLIVTAGGTDPHLAELASVGDMGRQIADLERNIAYAVYGSLIPATIVFQGGMAWFYLHTRKAMRTFIAATPPWVKDVLAAAA